ncbi:Putative pterin-4-alpha-carbinolamine dehydratase [Dyadobacter sp. CECT 9275]|uniref:4a-hydroxytetrahydrobiopterin dehydratase n=1 Tax=Dyadobacter helix TaxID=2822344 RepID=A0A916J909_9BACT|nr:4a-hydroxytetrahydrobiopterin dehydratase [Dyadobacter sp. CECT 9275]CAG4991747.1 Putative pterin-4-alpha-carbinolamine dehydratase [Dyadobacter sp. CECT 9275]
MWKEEDDKLKKNFRFRDFKEAFLFMSEVAKTVDEMDHHPWWSNVYNQVTFELTTHDAGDKVSDKDKKLASAIDTIAEKYR